MPSFVGAIVDKFKSGDGKANLICLNLAAITTLGLICVLHKSFYYKFLPNKLVLTIINLNNAQT